MKSKINTPSNINPIIAFGVHDSNLRLIERKVGGKIYPMESDIVIEGTEDEIGVVANILRNLFRLSQGNTPISHEEIAILIDESAKSGNYVMDHLASEGLTVSQKGRKIKPRSKGQLEYVRKIMMNDLVFSYGPAGTGKTYLAVALALHYLISGQMKKIILTRPVIEAGESLGFLPGTFEEKIDPYIRPLQDAIRDMLTIEEMKFYTESMVIELAPLAYMRGRTLSNAFVILDEAQNTTSTQMKMFLTRLGENSKMVVTGDISQTDLPNLQQSGLKQAIDIFEDVQEIGFHAFTRKDVVRHDLVKRIIEIYDNIENQEWNQKK